MEAYCIRHSDLPGTSRLFRDYLYQFDKVRSFYALDPHAPHVFEQAAAQIDYPLERRRAIVAALQHRNAGNPLLDKLAQSGTVAVVTGQQVGLFGGPAYSVYKALTAIRVAEDLSAQGIPAVPVFWLASEDHDFEEIHRFHYLTSDYRAATVRLDWPKPDHVPVGWLQAGSYPREEVQRAFAAFPFADDVAALLSGSYADGVSLSAAFQRLMEGVLGADRMLYLDPLDDAVRSLGGEVLAEAVERTPELAQALAHRNATLEKAGYHAQVHWEDNSSLFFHLDPPLRTSLRRTNGRYKTASGEALEFTPEELAAQPQLLSPNALLRPVWQDYLLPTISYVGGPAELAYMAQSEVLYTRLLGRMPVMLSRAFFTLLDARSQTIMKRHSLSLAELCTHEAEMKQRFARKLVPAELDQHLQAACDTISRQVANMREELTQFDPTLVSSLTNSEKKIKHQLQRIREKAAREALRRDHAAAADAAYLYDNLYPQHTLQERYYGILPFFARYGPDLIDRLYDHVSLACPDHIVVPV